MFLYAWSITEMIRYSFYAGGLLHMTPGVLTWLRYTLFIILYPIGVTVSNFIYSPLQVFIYTQKTIFWINVLKYLWWGYVQTNYPLQRKKLTSM